jgi:rare lipoprotein A
MRYEMVIVSPKQVALKPINKPIPRLLSSNHTHNWTELMRLQTALIPILILFSAPAYAGQTVTATWYGQELAGNRTASGERFNPNGLTAAHRSLPFGTCLLVSNPKTGRSVKVRVNDRGPFTKGVSLDLSHGAARAIGMRVTQSVIVDRC